MTNQSYHLVNTHFEQEKNRKAAVYTLLVTAAVIALLLIRFALPVVIEPIVDNGIEVNLGNSDFGSGDIAPAVPGDPAPEAQPEQGATPPPAAQPQVADEETEPDPEDIEPAITKTVVKAKPTPKPKDNPPVVTKPKEIKETPAPPQPKPKAQMGTYKGGNGTGGNNGDAFNNVKNQGIAGGNGDQGKPNGNPNSDNYKGNGGTGTGGVTVVSGNRRVVRAARLQGDFTQSATLVIRVKVAPDGSGTFVNVVSGMNQSQYTSIIRQRLASRDIQFSSGEEESFVNIQVAFKVN